VLLLFSYFFCSTNKVIYITLELLFFWYVALMNFYTHLHCAQSCIIIIIFLLLHS
jgi:hypothetical protein